MWSNNNNDDATLETPEMVDYRLTCGSTGNMDFEVDVAGDVAFAKLEALDGDTTLQRWTLADLGGGTWGVSADHDLAHCGFDWFAILGNADEEIRVDL
jgi:hypothetical protein